MAGAEGIVQEQNVIENMKNIRKNKNSENEIASNRKIGNFLVKGLAGLLAVMLVSRLHRGWWHPSLSLR